MGCGFRSMQPRLATQASPAASETTISSAVRPDGKLSTTVSSHVRPVSRSALLEERFAFGSVDEPLEHHGAAPHPDQGALGDAEVVADQVELGVPGAREVDLVGVGDRHRAASDLDDLLAAGHADTITSGAVSGSLARE